MHWRLALGMLAAIPVMALAMAGLTRALPPLAGYAAGLCLYWFGLAFVLITSFEREELAALMVLRLPGRVLTVLLVLPVLGVAWVAGGNLGGAGLPVLALPVIGLAAAANAITEELFWRGAILPRPDREAVLAAWGLFVIWHVALLFAAGIRLTGGPLALLSGAAVLGAIWMAARLQSGSAGAGIISHFGVNLFGFADLAATNWP